MARTNGGVLPRWGALTTSMALAPGRCRRNPGVIAQAEPPAGRPPDHSCGRVNGRTTYRAEALGECLFRPGRFCACRLCRSTGFPPGAELESAGSACVANLRTRHTNFRLEQKLDATTPSSSPPVAGSG